MQRRVWSAVMVLFLVGLVPPSLSSEVPEPYATLEVTPFGKPIRPIEGVGIVPIQIGVSCALGTVYPTPDSYVVDLSLETDADWVTTEFSPMSVAFELAPSDCLGGFEATVEGEIKLVFAPSAPAGGEVTLTLTATGATGEPAEVVWTETVAPYLRADARFEQAIWQVRPGTTTLIDLTVENRGNDALEVSTHLAEGTSDWLEVEVPGRFTVPAGEEVVVEVPVATGQSDGYVNRRDLVKLAVTFTTSQDPGMEEVVVQSLVVQTQGGLVGEAPASSWVGWVVPLFVVGAIMRRHGQRH